MSGTGTGRGLSHIRAEIARLSGPAHGRSLDEGDVGRTMREALATLVRTADCRRSPKLTWRLRMMIHAAGSETIDGSDLPPADFAVLALLDIYLAKREAVAGPEGVERALYGIVRILESGDEPRMDVLH